MADKMLAAGREPMGAGGPEIDCCARSWVVAGMILVCLRAKDHDGAHVLGLRYQEPEPG